MLRLTRAVDSGISSIHAHHASSAYFYCIRNVHARTILTALLMINQIQHKSEPVPATPAGVPPLAIPDSLPNHHRLHTRLYIASLQLRDDGVYSHSSPTVCFLCHVVPNVPRTTWPALPNSNSNSAEWLLGREKAARSLLGPGRLARIVLLLWLWLL